MTFSAAGSALLQVGCCPPRSTTIAERDAAAFTQNLDGEAFAARLFPHGPDRAIKGSGCADFLTGTDTAFNAVTDPHELASPATPSASEYGVVTVLSERCTATANALRRALRLAGTGPVAMREMQSCIRNALAHQDADGCRSTAKAVATNDHSPDKADGIAAFFAKRDLRCVGR